MKPNIGIDDSVLYSRATLAAALTIPYGRLFQAERRGEVIAPSIEVGRRRYYTSAERDCVIAWAEIKRRAGGR